jgi:hypothetical protein
MALDPIAGSRRLDDSCVARPRLAVALLVLIVAAGCGRSSTDDRRAPSPGQASRTNAAPATSGHSPAATAPTTVATSPNDSTPANPAASLPNLACGTAAPTAGDAAAEGWGAEAFSERALQQLQQFGRILEQRDDWDAADLTSVLLPIDRLAIAPLLPPQRTVAFEDGGVRVERWRAESSPDREPAATGTARSPAGDLGKGLVELARTFAGLGHRKTKFKVFRVETTDAGMQTRQYAHLSGSDNAQAAEYNATWIIDWETAAHDSPPRIKSLRVEVAELVTVPRRDTPWLVDCTESLLPDAPPTLRTCLDRGIDYWEARLDASCGVYNFGYHGLAVADVNGDGLEDVYACQTGGLPNHLLVRQPDGTVRDEAAEAGVDYLDNTRSALLVDLDNDEDADLVLATATGLLFLENNGRGRFSERARIASVREGFSLAAADYDGDSWLDVYVCVYYGQSDAASDLPLPLPYFDATNGGRNHLIRNRGQWKFEDATKATGLDQENSRFSFAATWEDYDRDGDLDLLVVNDFGQNQLYRNDQGRFRNVAREAGLVDGAFGMSATWSDFDRDGLQDIYVSNMFSAAGSRVTFDPRFKPDETAATRARFQHLARGNSLFRNRGDGTFEDVSVAKGVTMGRWSWGSLFADINNDGWDDLLVANGFITGRQPDDL